MKIAFIGLGIMGSRMATNLLEGSHDITVYNRTAAAAEPLVEKGATVASSLQECVQGADIILTMLSTPEVVEKVAFGAEGFAQYAKNQALWADCSTVNPSFSRRMGERAQAAGIRFIDSPVAGSKNQAAGKQLVFFAGGAAEDVEQVKPLFELMGKNTIHVGDIGMGASLKMLVNSLLAQSMVIFSENLLLGEALGIDRAFLLNLLPKLPVTAPFVQFKVDNIKEDKYEPEFPLEWMLKDVFLAIQSAYEVNVPQYMASTTREIFEGAKRAGLGRDDFSAVFKYLDQN